MACIPKAPLVAATMYVNLAKKPSIAIVAGSSTSEDVCPWESGSTEPRSRKNSIQLDSGSSSSDTSVAIGEVTEKIQRSCVLTQQHTLDSYKTLSTVTTEPSRRASVSVPITHSTGEASRRKIYSFEDSSATTSTSSSVFGNPCDPDNKKSEDTKTLKKSHSLAKTLSVTGANAPIISVSSVVDDSPGDKCEQDLNEDLEKKEKEDIAGYSQEAKAPLAEPDSESPASEFPPSEPEDHLDGGGEAKSNDVCPWEDEETCKVDTPFVKTYATLGYL
nr:uncharacterized protein LOC111513515 [Leptinotarsa decemlineata]